MYEFVCGGGLWDGGWSWPPAPSLVREGRAMLAALAGDLAAIAGLNVVVVCDRRIERATLPATCRVREVDSARQAQDAFEQAAAAADWSVVVVPEIGGALAERCRAVERVGGRLLGPSPQIVELASDKQRTAEHLARHGVPTPVGRRLSDGHSLPADFNYPAVLKPVDGAGSQGVRYIPRYEPGLSAGDGPASPPRATYRLESFCPGLPASVAVLCGPRERIPLPTCRQRLATDGSFSYLGGSLPLPPALDVRARDLAMRAVATLEQPRGYIGVDLVLRSEIAETDVAGGDAVIEINPRLTTSYVGLRAAARHNLAAAMLAVARGEPYELSFGNEHVQFDADGVVHSAGTNSDGVVAR